MGCKSLWRGVFNYHMGIIREYSFAFSKDQAKVVMARRIAKQQGVMPVVVLGYLKDHPHSYEIKLEVEYKEPKND